jgi:hypothetical protein
VQTKLEVEKIIYGTLQRLNLIFKCSYCVKKLGSFFSGQDDQSNLNKQIMFNDSPHKLFVVISTRLVTLYHCH